MTKVDAEEFTQSLGMITGGTWRQIMLADKLGVPKAYGLTLRDWVNQHLGGYMRLSIEDRREAVAELTAEGHSNCQIAEALGVDEGTIRNDKRSENSEPKKREPKEGKDQKDGDSENSEPKKHEPKKDNAPIDADSENAELKKDEPKPSMSIHFSSETPEHYTPNEIISAVLACMGEIDLDPCSNSADTPNVPAHQHFTISDDGLSKQWHGRIYMNPPYGREIMQWVSKLCAEHEAGRTAEAIALVPARTDTAWFARLRDYPVCFITGRLTFIGNDDPAPFPSAVFYLGEDIGGFYRAFASLGDIWQRLEPDNEGQCWPARFAE